MAYSVYTKLTPAILDGLRFDMQIDVNGKPRQPTPAGAHDWIIRDTQLPGLSLRLTPATISWNVQRKVGGKPKRYKIGTLWSAHPGHAAMNLTEARSTALAWLGWMAQGLDPRVMSQRAASGDANQPNLAMQSLAQAYAVDMKLMAAKDAVATASARQWVQKWMEGSRIWSLPIGSIRREDVEATYGVWLRAVNEHAPLPSWGPRRISRGTLDKLYMCVASAHRRAAAGAGLPDHTFTAFSQWRKYQRWPEMPVRTRYLAVDKPDGLAWFKHLDKRRTEANELARTTGESNPALTVMFDLYMCLLLWGTRLGETRRLTWSRVDFERGLVSFPKAESKTKRAYVVPLTPWAREILEQRRNANRAWHPNETSDWVFQSREAGKHLVDGNRALEELEAATGLWITAHDLRRTLATKLGKTFKLEQVARLVVVGAALNHAKGSAVTQDYLQEGAESLRPSHERWEDLLRGLLGLPSLTKLDCAPSELQILLADLEKDPTKERDLVDVIAKRRGWNVNVSGSKTDGDSFSLLQS